MEKYQTMKTIITSALEYSKHRSEKVYNFLHRQLQLLGVNPDLSVFDPGSSIAVEFFVSLHELLSNLDPMSSILWVAIDVLKHACSNPAARQALIHTYKFSPILTKLLAENLIEDKKIRVLRLLQELTYGVKISWQEAHLPYLIGTLTNWIVSGEREVVCLSLGVLVNLCYKNLPAVYTLMRSVDSKQFLRTILKLQNDNINTRVQVCKLLIILEHISGEIPDTDILNFMNVAFSTVGDTFKARDVFLLKHMVDFFRDVQINPHSREVLLTYHSFPSDTEQLLVLLNDGTADPECAGMLFEFFNLLVKLQINGLHVLYPRLITAAMNWLKEKTACTQALLLIRSVAMDSRHGGGDMGGLEVRQNVVGQLDHALMVLLKIVEDTSSFSLENRTQITALLQLLQEMGKTPALRHKVLQNINPQTMQKIFQPLLTMEPKEGDNLFESEVTTYYVHALDFMSDLTSHDAHWMKLYSEILQHKQVQMVLAVALYTGKEDVKRQVLALTGTIAFPAESISLLAKSLCDLEPLVLVSNNAGTGKTSAGVGSFGLTQIQDMTPLFTLTQEGRLDSSIAKLQEALQNNRIQDISTSAVMELYEYKLAALGHSERGLQASLEAANTHSTHLQHRLAQMSAEASKLHQLLYHNQQCLEGLRMEKEALSSKIESLHTSAEEDLKKHLTEIKSKQRLIGDLNSGMEELTKNLNLRNEELRETKQQMEGLYKQLEDMTNQLALMDQKHKEQASTNKELTRTLTKLEERLAKRQKMIDDKCTEIDKQNQNIQNLQMELANYKMLCKAQEKNIMEKEAEVSQTRLQLNELERMREVIFEISAGKKKMDK
ncbi:hypothetical protein C0J52_13148 [Blattella germanica]|nr:hypothetical protein C0J52_13148 [Blattella germanica]